MGALQPIGITLLEPSENAVGKAGEGLRAVAAKGFLQYACRSPAIHNRGGTSVVPQNGGASRVTVGIHQPATVPLSGQRDKAHWVGQLMQNRADRGGHRVPY
jgi:hypothetical protein